jgi:hypothetical protein
LDNELSRRVMGKSGFDAWVCASPVCSISSRGQVAFS